MSERLDLNPVHAKIAREILDKFLPRDTVVRVFGSRAKGRARRFSDLDLAVKCANPLTLEQSADLNHAFSESDLPFKVDVVDWLSAPPFLQEIIERDGIELVAVSSPA